MGPQIFDPADYELAVREQFLHTDTVIYSVTDTSHSTQEVKRLYSVWLIYCPSERNDTGSKSLEWDRF